MAFAGIFNRANEALPDIEVKKENVPSRIDETGDEDLKGPLEAVRVLRRPGWCFLSERSIV